ncbi:MAG: hypothetical protein K8T91_14470 [Planctomycetes bacterium]|nr:hypothetical protein [Planctomycetota bacterium]
MEQLPNATGDDQPIATAGQSPTRTQMALAAVQAFVRGDATGGIPLLPPVETPEQCAHRAEINRVVSAVEKKLLQIEGVTFVLVTDGDHSGSYGPSIGAAVALADHAMISGEVPDSHLSFPPTFGEGPGVSMLREEAEEEVIEQIDRLRGKLSEFALLWHVDGSIDVHLDRSEGFTANLACTEIAELLSKVVSGLNPGFSD